MKLNQSQHPAWLWVFIIICFLALSRLIPHPPNFTPIGAMALLAGIYIKDLKLVLLIPLAAMLASDSLLGFHSSMIYVYTSVALIAVLSSFLIKQRSAMVVLFAATGAACLFFLVTNFGAWLSHDMYEKSITGLKQAYIAGIPFFRNTLLSNLLFSMIGFYALKQLPNKQHAQL